MESFNGRLRDELLSSEIFGTLAEARLLVDRWRLHYNHRRIQRALGKLTPAAFAATCPALPPLRLAALRQRRAWRVWPPCTNSHKGWTDESDPVRRLLSAPWAVKVSHKGWTCSAHPCQYRFASNCY